MRKGLWEGNASCTLKKLIEMNLLVFGYLFRHLSRNYVGALFLCAGTIMLDYSLQELIIIIIQPWFGDFFPLDSLIFRECFVLYHEPLNFM